MASTFKKEGPLTGPFFFSSYLLLMVLFAFTLFFPLKVGSMEVYSLENGLNYILEERKNTGVVAIQIWMSVGSKDEDDRVPALPTL